MVASVLYLLITTLIVWLTREQLGYARRRGEGSWPAHVALVAFRACYSIHRRQCGAMLLAEAQAETAGRHTTYRRSERYAARTVVYPMRIGRRSATVSSKRDICAA